MIIGESGRIMGNLYSRAEQGQAALRRPAPQGLIIGLMTPTRCPQFEIAGIYWGLACIWCLWVIFYGYLTLIEIGLLTLAGRIYCGFSEG